MIHQAPASLHGKTVLCAEVGGEGLNTINAKTHLRSTAVRLRNQPSQFVDVRKPELVA
jgi:hypothetical protein